MNFSFQMKKDRDLVLTVFLNIRRHCGGRCRLCLLYGSYLFPGVSCLTVSHSLPILQLFNIEVLTLCVWLS